MVVERLSSSELLKNFMGYVETLPVNRIDKLSRLRIEKTVQVIKTEISNHALYVECDFGEIETLLCEYLKMLGNKHHLAIFAIIDRLASVDSVLSINRVCKEAEYYEVFPENTYDDKIKLYISFFTNENGYLDVDYAVKTILDKK